MKVTSKIKTGKIFTIDFDALPKASQRALIEYGAQRWINDRVNSTSNAKGIKEPDQIDKLGEDFYERLLEGRLGPVRTSADPRLEVVVDMVAAKAGKTKKATRAAIKEQGLDKFIEALGGDKVIQEEIDRRAKAAQEIDSGDFDDLFKDLEA